MNRFVPLPLLGLALAVLFTSRALAQSAPLSPDRVTFFTEPNFRGEALTIEAGAAVEDLERLQRPGGRPWLFAISSVRLEGAARATVFSGPRYTGQRLEVTRDIADLYGEARAGVAGGTWDRAIASVRVSGPPRTVITAPPPRTVRAAADGGRRAGPTGSAAGHRRAPSRPPHRRTHGPSRLPRSARSPG